MEKFSQKSFFVVLSPIAIIDLQRHRALACEWSGCCPRADGEVCAVAGRTAYGWPIAKAKIFAELKKLSWKSFS